MSKIKAALTVELGSITKIPDGLVGTDDLVYAAAWIGTRFFGKSKPLLEGEDSFRFAAERMKWRTEIAADGSPIPLKVALYKESFNTEPTELYTFETDLEAPYESGDFVLAGTPCLDFTVESRSVSERQYPANVARADKGDTSRATLRTPLRGIVEFGEIRGLYRPKNEGRTGLERSEYVEGYRSEDNQGRVYLDRDLEGNWKKNVQQIEVSATVNIVGADNSDNCWVRWSIVDIDDPSDDRLDCHWEAGVILDPVDYDEDYEQLGSGAADNEGEQGRQAWQEVDGFALLDNDTHAAKTVIVGNESRIRYNCPNVAGDNFILRAEVLTSKPMECFAAHTGAITLWHRLGVETLQMQSALPLPVEDVPPSFEPACVQLDFKREDSIPDEPFIAQDEDALNEDATFFVDGVSLRARENGWFTIIGALEAVPAPPSGGREKRRLYSGAATLSLEESGSRWYQVLEVPGDHLDAQLATVRADDRRIHLLINRTARIETDAGIRTRAWLEPHSQCKMFKAGSGSTQDAYRNAVDYFPGIDSQFDRPLGEVDEVEAEIFALGRSLVTSLTPKAANGGKAHYSGKALLFTHHPLFYDSSARNPRRDQKDRLRALLIGEICHLFGLPDKCCNFDFRTPQNGSCAMNYGFQNLSHLVGDIDGDPTPPREIHFCARHLKEMRRTHFFEHKGLNWS